MGSLTSNEQIEAFRHQFEKLTDSQLLHEAVRFVPDAAQSVAAQQLLHERREAREKKRFHWYFWPAVVAAIAGALSLAVQVLPSATSGKALSTPSPQMQTPAPQLPP